MSAFLQLLSVGRSLVTPHASRQYLQSRKPAFLPTFRLVQRANSQEPVSRRGWKLPIRFFGSSRPETVELNLTPASNPVGHTSDPAEPVLAPAKQPTARAILSSSGTSNTAQPGRVLFAFRVPAPTNGALVQAELKLAQVTVVRNDLSEADLEVVSRKRALEDASTTPTVEDKGSIGYTLKDWSRLAGRLTVFGRSRA